MRCHAPLRERWPPTVPGSTAWVRYLLPCLPPRMLAAVLTGVRTQCRRPCSVDWPLLWRPARLQRPPGRLARRRLKPRLSPRLWRYPRLLLRRLRRSPLEPLPPPVPRRRPRCWPQWWSRRGQHCWPGSLLARERVVPPRTQTPPLARVIRHHHRTVPAGAGADLDRPAVHGFQHRCPVGNWANESRRGSSGAGHGRSPASRRPAPSVPYPSAWSVWPSSSDWEAPGRRSRASSP